MSWRFQECGPTDESDFLQVRSWVYDGRPPLETDRLADIIGGGRRYLARVDDQPVGVTNCLTLRARHAHGFLPLAGVATVGIAPTHRNGGYGQRLMAEVIRAERAAGMVAGALYAFRDKFYRKQGYASGAAHRMEMHVPVDRMPSLTQTLEARVATSHDVEGLAACHAAFISPYALSVDRHPDRWERMLASQDSQLFALGNPVEAYVYARVKGFYEVLEVNEFAWSSRAGYESGLAFIRSLAINQSSVKWCEPEDCPFMSRFHDGQVEISVDREAMVRIYNVPGALTLLKPLHSGAFRLRVTDPILPENEGPWRVEFSPSGTTCTLDSGGDAPLVEVDIATFSGAFFGHPGWRHMHRMGLVAVDRATLDALEALMPTGMTYHSELY